MGFLASVLVIAAFSMKDLVSLRATALASNVAFLVYGIALGLAPIWLLHAILLPVNCWRLWQHISQDREAASKRSSLRTWEHFPGECSRPRLRRGKRPH